jgi:hypothetical protein
LLPAGCTYGYLELCSHSRFLQLPAKIPICNS